jgi:hypothetical protein
MSIMKEKQGTHDYDGKLLEVVLEVFTLNIARVADFCTIGEVLLSNFGERASPQTSNAFFSKQAIYRY